MHWYHIRPPHFTVYQSILDITICDTVGPCTLAMPQGLLLLPRMSPACAVVVGVVVVVVVVAVAVVAVAVAVAVAAAVTPLSLIVAENCQLDGFALLFETL